MGRAHMLPALLTAGLATISACASAASVLFDIPETEPHTATARVTSVSPLAQDTVRPRIESLTNKDSILAILPKDSATGAIAWDEAQREGVIRPYDGPRGAWRKYLEGFGYDLVLKSSAGSFAASFPHSRHVAQFTCESCHPSLWGGGETDDSMRAINAGESCGTCHRGVAFPASACGRCHEGLPTPSVTPVLEDDLVLARDMEGAQAASQVFPPSRFAHWVHRIRYRCSACHTDLFALEAGADTLTMARLGRGEGCGACHDAKQAFGLTACNRCHVAPDRSGDSSP